MKLGRCSVENFGSYKHLEFDFQDLGLALVYGPTGSGKSTIADIAPWILLGMTSKEGNADEVRSWAAKDDTQGALYVSGLNGSGAITVYRKRGKTNDLYWTEEGDDEKKYRGKDLKDTQKRLEERLGISSEHLLLTTYFSEFSSAGSFFVAAAKERRAVFERIATLEFPIRLALKASAARKEAKKAQEAAQIALSKNTGSLEYSRNAAQDALNRAEKWTAAQNDLLNKLEVACANFDMDTAAEVTALSRKSDKWEADQQAAIATLSAEIDSLKSTVVDDTALRQIIEVIERKAKEAGSKKCPTCGGPCGHKERDKLQADLREVDQQKNQNDARKYRLDSKVKELARASKLVNPHTAQLDSLLKTENHYAAQVQAERSKKNPFNSQIDRFADELEALEAAVVQSEKACEAVAVRLSALNELYDLSYALRGAMLAKAVEDIQAETNRLLTRYFEGEISVKFALEGADNLDVKIQKSGYDCVYRQLSRGQRSMLRLCFVVAMQKIAANNAGLHMDWLCFDEVLDGLDAGLKVKAFGIFEELAVDHGTVLMIDHSPDFQSLFNKRYRVELIGDNSEITEET